MVARISAWQAVGVIIYAGLAISLLLLVMTSPRILDRLDRWADKRGEGDE